MELTGLSAVAMAKLVREKKISPVELVRAHLEHIDRLNPSLNAFVHLRAEESLRAAHAAERRVMAGEAEPLMGVPISVKSCIDVADMHCEAGSRLRTDYVANSDAVAVARIQKAGAIVIGTTNAAELLLAYDTDNDVHGRTNNPWNLECTAGGSSGGESAAIASGMSAAGFGSDGGGSVRVPAHFTGICALKPTPGRIPGTGHFPECIGPWAMMGVVGPMARTVEDLRAIFDATAGPDDGDPFSAPVKESTGVEIRGARIGILDCGTPATEEMNTAVRAAATALEECGATVEPFRFARFDDAIEIWRLIFVRATYEVMRDTGNDPAHGRTICDFVAYAATQPDLTARVLLSGLLERDRIRAEYLRAARSFVALISPPCSDVAFRHGKGGWGPSHPTDYIQTMRHAQFANVLGLPAAVVPVGCSRDRLPIGVQVIGRPYDEHGVLDVARIIEKHFGFNAPPMVKAHDTGTAAAAVPSSGQSR